MIDFAKIGRLAVDADLRVQTAQVAGYGDDADGGDVEQEDAAEVLHPCGFMSRPVVSDTLEGVVVTRGDEPVVLVLIDKGAPAQDVESGEARMHGVNGSTNAAAVIRIRASGAIEVTAKSAQNITLSVSGGGSIVLAGGSLEVARRTDPVTPSAALLTTLGQIATLLNTAGPVVGAPGTVTPFSGSAGAITSGAANVKA
jgi:hypothetical protein